MKPPPFCFVVMPFRAELNYFYLYLQKHLQDKHGLRVERGDHNVLTKALMDKVREQIVEADVLLGDVTSANPNVFYEIGLAHAYGKPVIFLTQDDPAATPVDVRQFEFIHYDLRRHDEFLAKLDNAVQNVFSGKYRALYAEATDLLRRFNQGTGSSYGAASLEEFQSRVMREEQVQEMPPVDAKEQRAGFLLPKILASATDLVIMQKVMKWVGTPSQ
jgi:nucleoside 2-deoxyribosyltransferase